MKPAARTLAEFVTSLDYSDIPADVVEKAKACIIDTIAASVYGAQLPWSKIIIEYVRRTSAPGHSSVLGTDLRVRAPFAALANGALSHSFELDAPVHPSVGVHPGPGCVLPGLAVSQGFERSGKDLIAAFVAGFEAMHRMADTSPQSSEKKGFHAPGLFGTFGGAMTAGRLMGLDAERMTNALGIAGSLCSGLLEFSKSGTGGMVKRLHPGRAAEGGVMAAALAREGFTGPPTIIEGKFGFLNVFCSDADLSKLTAGLGEVWQTTTVAHKRYAAHSTAHVPMTAVLALKAEHRIAGDDIASIVVAGNEKIVSHHDIKEPQDITAAQYSVPFCVAVACFRDPLDPNVFSEASVNDPAIRQLCRNVRLEVLKDAPKDQGKASRVTVKLKNGRELVREMHSYPGMPEEPLTTAELRKKFDTLTAALPAGSADRIFTQFIALEDVQNLRTIQFS
ncbi:MAG: MmgE/PrpD family protein [Burkholderiales bacterium]